MASIEETVVINSVNEGSASFPLQFKSIFRVIRSRLTWLSFVATTLAVYAGWIGRYERNITAENGMGYALGIVGASMMAALLIYPLRKRISSLRVLGPTRVWFKLHMLLGIIGPVLILYHSNFTVSSLNSRVALFCTLLVAVSGLIGRYLYAQVHHGLYGGKSSLRSLVGQMHGSMTAVTASGPVMAEFLEQITAIDNSVLEPPRNVFHSAIRPFLFAFRTRLVYLQMSLRLRRNMAFQALPATTLAQRERENVRATRLNLRRHLKQVRKVAHLGFFERLFSLWHILHLPFFLMLLISVIVHIVAVHMY